METKRISWSASNGQHGDIVTINGLEYWCPVSEYDPLAWSTTGFLAKRETDSLAARIKSWRAAIARRCAQIIIRSKSS